MWNAIPITEVKLEPAPVADEDGSGGGAGLGAELHGSRPSESYIELDKGLSAIKLAPRLFTEFVP